MQTFSTLNYMGLGPFLVDLFSLLMCCIILIAICNLDILFDSVLTIFIHSAISGRFDFVTQLVGTYTQKKNSVYLCDPYKH